MGDARSKVVYAIFKRVKTGTFTKSKTNVKITAPKSTLANTPGAVPVIEQDTATTHTFSNLVAGVKYTIDVNAAGTAGTSDWSGAISLTAD